TWYRFDKRKGNGGNWGALAKPAKRLRFLGASPGLATLILDGLLGWGELAFLDGRTTSSALLPPPPCYEFRQADPPRRIKVSQRIFVGRQEVLADDTEFIQLVLFDLLFPLEWFFPGSNTHLTTPMAR